MNTIHKLPEGTQWLNDDFPKVFRHFFKTSKSFLNLSEDFLNVSEDFL